MSTRIPIENRERAISMGARLGRAAGALAACGAIVTGAARAEIPVIPGAVGFGIETPAGRGGRVLRVTNLNDSGPGSLRAALEASGPRIVVFDVSGTITLASEIRITSPYVTIAGQTAPSPGITVRGDAIAPRTHDILMQHLRVRTGYGAGASQNTGAIQLYNPGASPVYDVVIDHCSASWAINENLTTWGTSGDRVHDVTFRYAISSEGLDCTPVSDEGCHSKGLLIGDGNHDIAVLRSLFAHDADRLPELKGGASAVVVNNVMYDWDPAQQATHMGREGAFNEPTLLTVEGNVYLQGPEMDGRTAYAIEASSGIPLGSQVHDGDNHLEFGTRYAGTIGLFRNDAPFDPRVSFRPIWVPGLIPLASRDVEAHLLDNAGARPCDRDAVDERIIDEVRNRTGRIIDDQSEVGGWPALAENSRPAGWDTDGDGMPDSWKARHGLDPSGAADGSQDADGGGYTNVEEYLHDAAREVECSGPPAPANAIDVPGDAPTIQAAIDLAQPGDLVLVAPGTYRSGSTIHVNKPIVLASWYHTTGVESYIDQTIIDSSAGTTLDVTSAGAGALVTGFTIQGPDKGIQLLARGDVTHCSFVDTGGDSLSWEDGGAGRFAHNRFVNCGDDCIDSDNDSNGVASGDRIIEHNTMNGAGDDCIEIRLHSYSGPEMDYQVRYNTIENCDVDGVQLIDYSGISSRRFFIYRNLIVTRSASGIGATAGGSSDQTGGGSPLAEPVQIYNNTIVGPQWGIVGGANMLIVNNIIMGASAHALHTLQGDSWAAHNVLHQNGADADAVSQPRIGEGTLHVDPLLDPAYRLLSGSPCIDTGVRRYERSGQVVEVTDDLGGAPDIGADEFGGGGPTTNRPPAVSAGPDRLIRHPADTVLLDGTVTDDGRPGVGLDITWSALEGPGTATFSDPDAEDTGVTLDRQGTYKLEIEASDGELTSADSVLVRYVQDGTGAKHDIAAPGSTYVEAEAYSWLYAPAAGLDDPAAWGGRAVIAPEGQGTEARSEYTLVIRQDGFSYYAWIRMAAPGSLSDSLAVSFDDGSERMLSTTADDTYHWEKVDGSFPSPAGEYVLVIRAAEDGVRWDSIVFTTDAAFVPDDTPATRVDVRVSSDSDDAEESSSGSVTLGSSDLELVTEATVQTVGMRFAGVEIPPNAVIRSASLQFQADEASSGPTTLTIHGQAADDASAFTTAAGDISSRPRTAAQALWSPPAWSTIGAAGPDQRTVNLSAVIQEIVNRQGWQSGSALALIVTGTGKRVAVAHDGAAGAAPLLRVELAPPSPDTTPPAAPTGLRATGKKTPGVIQLTWDASSEPDLAGYLLLYGIASGVHTSSVDVGNVTSHKLQGLDSATTYYLVLKAYDSTGNISDPSSEVSARPRFRR